MASANIKEITDANFDAEVIKSPLLTLVEFWAGWASGSKVLAPIMDGVADDYVGRVKVGRMDVDRHVTGPEQYNVRSVPTMLFFKGGKVVSQLVGTPSSRARIDTEIQKYI